MTSLIDKIELLIKREKTTPERKKDDSKKSSNEILSELFGAFNADPPKIEEVSSKKSKKSKKKHKKEKKKRSRSSSSSSSDDSDYSHKRKKRKKSKSKKKSRHSRTPSPPPSFKSKFKIDPGAIKLESLVKLEKETSKEKVKKAKESVKIEPKEIKAEREEIGFSPPLKDIDTSLIPMPESPKDTKSDDKQNSTETEKNKGRIQIKNLKFSTVFEETVKKAEEEARRKAERYEEGEYTDSSSKSSEEVVVNSQFPKSSDPGGILKKVAEETKVSEEERSHRKSKKSESSHKSSKRDRDRSRTPKRSSSKRRSRSRHRDRHRSSSRSRTSKSRHRSRSREARKRSNSRSRLYTRHRSPRERGYRGRRSSRSPSGVKLADSEKKRLLEVARRNAINMLKNGAVPAGAAALPPHTRNQVMAAIHSGGKSVDELTDFCKHLSKKEALGELSSVSSNDGEISENEDTLAFHHPFLVKEKAPIIMNIRGGAPLPIKSSVVQIANKEELRLQFPVSSGSQHRDSEWVPVEPKKDNMQVAKLSSKPALAPAPVEKAIEINPVTKTLAPLALPAPPPAPLAAPLPAPLAAPLPAPLPALPAPVAPLPPPPEPPAYIKGFSTGTELSTVPALPVPGPQAYPPGVQPPNIDLASIVSQKLLMIRKEQEQNELSSNRGVSDYLFGWSKESKKFGQFTGSTGAHILTPKELASGTQAWAKKDQLQRAAPVEGGMGMHLLQKMGWTPGQGLGKEGTGTLQPLLLEVKLDTKGLQAKEEVSGRFKGTKSMRGRGAGGRGAGAGAAGGAGGGGAGAALLAGGKHPVSLLGEYCSKQKLGPPEYNLCFECGPDHKKNFLFKVKVAGTEYQPAVASANKKQAKADSAQLALQKLGILP